MDEFTTCMLTEYISFGKELYTCVHVSTDLLAGLLVRSAVLSVSLSLLIVHCPVARP